jgi:diguanylate cyclase
MLPDSKRIDDRRAFVTFGPMTAIACSAMRHPENKEASAEILRQVLPQISRHGSGFQPKSYAIWYESVAGCNPSLQKAIDARIAKGGALTPDETEALFAAFVATRDLRALETLSGQLQESLEAFGRLASAAASDSHEYGRSLQAYGEQLVPQLDLEAMRSLIGAMAAETQRMQQSNKTLSEQLEASQREFVDLKAKLATVQSEALLDPLTKLTNRRGFQRRVDELLTSRADGLVGCALIMADIDHFKKINDTYGHLLGDKVLQAVAQVLLASVKGRDVAARLGGEEFAILLPDTPEQGACVLAEQIRQTVSQGRIRRGDANDPIDGVTISLGVAAYHPRETLEQWIDRADAALYRSKQTGRNRVTVAATEAVAA